MFYSHFIPDLKHFQNNPIFEKYKNMTDIVNPLPGTELAIPISIFERIFTKLHYNSQPIIPYLFLVYSLISYSTYGLDRYLDALEYNTTTIKPMITESKIKLYDYLLNNKEFMNLSLFVSYALLTKYFTENQETIIFLPLLLLNSQYKSIKKNYSDIKSSLIGIMWVLCSIVLPCVLYEHNYDILKDYQTYLPAFLSLISTSNVADIRDIEEDKINNVNTIPVKFGARAAYMISSLSLIISSIIFYNHPNFEFNVENCLFELSNLGGLYAIMKQNNNTLVI